MSNTPGGQSGGPNNIGNIRWDVDHHAQTVCFKKINRDPFTPVVSALFDALNAVGMNGRPFVVPSDPIKAMGVFATDGSLTLGYSTVAYPTLESIMEACTKLAPELQKHL